MMHAIAAKAVAFGEALRPEFKAYAASVVGNAVTLTATLAAEGMRPVSGGTDTHLALIDLRALGVTGAEAERRCGMGGIALNRNVIPYDPAPPTIASGIRIGTPCVTTQGMGPPEMVEIASIILQAVLQQDAIASVAERVKGLTATHPAYPRGE
jgi:glycine hydroxymethyltransferase